MRSYKQSFGLKHARVCFSRNHLYHVWCSSQPVNLSILNSKTNRRNAFLLAASDIANASMLIESLGFEYTQ